LDDAIAQATEENDSEEKPLSMETSLAVDVPSSEEQNTTGKDALEEDRVVAEAKAREEEVARQKAAEEQAMRERAAQEKAAQEKAAREKAAREKAAKAKIIVLKPRKKTWLGIVNLTNMKRRVATAKTPQTFDTSKGRWIVATGHGHIDFDEGVNHKKFNDGKQHFFLIQKGKVAEISHKKFQQLNKSKVW
jgi:hypothetical protein